MEITSNDIKCSHGVTIEKIEKKTQVISRIKRIIL